MATWAIGDVHGCYRTLRELLARAGVTTEDRLWFVGDLVNRGPGSLDTLRFVAGLGDRATVVLGNHDLHFLARAAGVAPARPNDRFDDLLAASDLDELSGWLSEQRLLHVDGDRVLVHAGIPAGWDLPAAVERARRAEAALSSTERDLYLEAFRPQSDGDQERRGPQVEILDDLRILTLMRTVDRSGAPSFDFTGPLADLPPDRLPWFDAPGRSIRDRRIVCGHWAALGLLVRRDLVALDTGCAWGGRLTAVCLDDDRLVQARNLDL